MALATGDLDGNGEVDLIVLNGNDRDVSVLLSLGDGGFAGQVTYPVGGSAWGAGAVAVADFNGDGRLDLAVTSYCSLADGGECPGAVAVLLNEGGGTFGAPQDYVVGDEPVALAVGDFNGDGRPDIAVVSGDDNAVSVLLNSGGGGFSSQQTYGVGLYPLAIAAADFNGDGRLDLAVANFGASSNTPGTVSVLLNDGDGGFASQTTFGAGAGPVAISAGDFSNDGKVDLAVANEYDDSVSVLINDGTGAFAGQVSYVTGSFPESLVVGDFDGDGQLDIAVATGGTDGFTLLVNSGGTFTQTAITVGSPAGAKPPSPIGAVASADFNGDGRSDLATIYGPFDEVGVLTNEGNGWGIGGLKPEVDYFIANPSGVVTGDFAGEGKLDLALESCNTSDTACTLNVLLNEGAGTFAAAVTYPSTPWGGLAPGDFNGDGKLDLAVAGCNMDSGTCPGSVGILFNEGDGVFSTQTVSYPVGNFPTAPAVADFDEDGRLDLAVANDFDGTASVLMNQGGGIFGPQVTYAVAWLPIAIAAGDLDADGKPDLAVASDVTNGGIGVVCILLNEGGGGFSPQVTYSAGYGLGAMALGDFSGDDRPDIVTASNGIQGTGVNVVNVLLNQGDGTFSAPVTYAASGTPRSLAVGDFNGDGRLDLLVVGEYGNSLAVLLGQGDGTFAPQVDFPVGNLPSSVAVGDFAGNGLWDVAVTNTFDNTVGVLLNACGP